MSGLLVVVGLRAEGRIAGPRAQVLAGGGDSVSLSRRLNAIHPSGLTAVVSFGLAGALEPDLAPGDVILATAIAAERQLACSETLRGGWGARLRGAGLHPRESLVAGVDAPVLDPSAKARLRARAGASAVDMESHIAAAYAARHRLPFGALRVISDSADHVLPAVAGRAMRPDGGIDVGAVIFGLVQNPGQIAGLIVTARQAGAAFKTLRHIRRILGADLGTS